MHGALSSAHAFLMLPFVSKSVIGGTVTLAETGTAPPDSLPDLPFGPHNIKENEKRTALRSFF